MKFVWEMVWLVLIRGHLVSRTGWQYSSWSYCVPKLVVDYLGFGVYDGEFSIPIYKSLWVLSCWWLVSWNEFYPEKRNRDWESGSRAEAKAWEELILTPSPLAHLLPDERLVMGLEIKNKKRFWRHCFGKDPDSLLTCCK